MTSFHTWRCKCEGVGRDLGCRHEASHRMHDTKYSIYDCIVFMEYDWIFYVCHCMCILGGE